ncbi:MAG TPA: asparagine synthase (glutamine-hydrolyzing) [Gemmatimonadales bacterium]|jgi:asparagine synthase (glutamine-hydrolysing)
MCGIAGVAHLSGTLSVDRARLDLMCDAVRHRGPDDRGVYLSPDGKVGLGHRRLAIIDLASGHQPMCRAGERAWISFNGEIYNYRELRQQLVEQGVAFRTASDTEVILALYERGGPGAFEKLNGIFAFALYDTATRELHLVRDHLGVKPLYYAYVRGVLVFGSEIKALLAYQDRGPALDYEALGQFLSFRYNPAPRTMLAGIQKLPAGHRLVARPGAAPVVERFWNRPARTNHTITFQDASDEYRRLLRAAVRRQLVSDVPVGLFLSGGVDSAAVGKFMMEGAAGPVRSYAVGFAGRGDFNELDDARASAAYLGTEHHEIELSRADYLRTFVQAVRYVEEPVAESTIPALSHVAALAARDLKVVLAGQGADELLAGYTRYLGASFLAQPLVRMLARLAGPLAGALPRAGGLRRAAYSAAASTELERCLRLVSILSWEEKSALATPETRSHWQEPADAVLAPFYAGAAGLEPGLARLLYLDARTLLPDDLLLFNDKITMQHALEMRVPFLDLELVEFAESLPARFKLSWGRRKRIHKVALERELPDWIRHRKKRGFATPMDEWLQSSLGSRARELLTRPGSACSRYFDVAVIRRMAAEHEARSRDRRHILFALLSFELWHEVFLDGHKPEEGYAAQALVAP